MPGWVDRLARSILLVSARALERTGARTLAVKLYRHSLRLDCEDLSTVRHLARLLGALGERRGRLELLEKIVLLAPNDLGTWSELGEWSVATGNYQKALPIFQRLESASPQNPKHTEVLGEIYLKLNQPVAARDRFLRLLAQSKDRHALRWLFKIGQLFLIHKQPQEALSTYRSILEIIPGETTAQLALSRLAFAGGDLDEATRWLQQQSRAGVDPGGLDERLSAARRLRDAALKELILDGRVTDPPDRVSIQGPDGPLLVKVPDGFIRSAKPVYSPSEQRQLRKELIVLYLTEGQIDRALFHLSHYKPTDEKDQEFARAHRGIALARKGELGLAKRELDRLPLERLGSPSPRKLELLYQIGLVYLHCGAGSRALLAFKRILLFDIGFRDVEELVRRLRQANTPERTRGQDENRTRSLLIKPSSRLSHEARGGRLIGRYVLGERQKQGFLGEIYKGKDSALGLDLAIRRLSPVICNDSAVRDRFIRSAREATSLSHPNLVPILDIVEMDKEVWIVTRWFPGVEASRLVSGGRPMPAGFAVELAKQAAEALAEAHSKAILHRDLKGSDFHVDMGTRTLRILDLGLSGVSNTLEVAPLDYLQRRCDYMPPEFILGERLDERGDIYSVGMFLYLLVTGRLPFDEPDLHARMFRYLDTPVLPLRERCPTIPFPLEQAILRCLSKEKAARPANGKELASLLSSIRGHCR